MSKILKFSIATFIITFTYITEYKYNDEFVADSNLVSFVFSLPGDPSKCSLNGKKCNKTQSAGVKGTKQIS